MSEVAGTRSKRVAAGAGLSLGAALGMGATAEAAEFGVTNLSDSGPGSLRDAIAAANANNADSDRIVFQSDLSGTLALASTLGIYGPVEIVGSGADQVTLQGGVNVSPFFVELAPDPGAVRITDLTLTGANNLGSGGGIFADYRTSLTLERMVIRGNRTERGAGVFAGGPLTIRDSTIADNAGTGGGSSGGGVNSYAETVLIENTTISGNTAEFGGGVALTGKYHQATVRNSTVAGNTATQAGGGIRDTTEFDGVAELRLESSIVADNAAPEGADVWSTGNTPDVPTTASFSLIETSAFGPFTQAGPNLIGEDPQLLPLADNGGPTPTHALAANSPARDKGNAFGFDQRGAPRPFDLKGPDSAAGGNGADIGAYERVLCGRITVNEIGTAGDDLLIGGPGKDGILGLGGKDKLRGRGGKDGLCGNGGKDRLLGGGGNDRLLGGRGSDVLNGGKGKDTLKGGRGNDKKKS